MARRRQTNPSPTQWALIGVGAVAAGAAGYYGIRELRERSYRKRLQELPVPTPDASLPPPDRSPQGDTGCGPEYPGFTVTRDGGCEPGPRTPPGIYIAERCSDFVFVPGEEGPQPKHLEDLISEEAVATADDAAVSSDPTDLAVEFFIRFWPECAWPPPPTASPRIVNLFQALSYMIGQEVVKAGGRVLGTKSIDDVDEQVAERLELLGYPQYDPDVVPEFQVNDADSGPSSIGSLKS